MAITPMAHDIALPTAFPRQDDERPCGSAAGVTPKRTFAAWLTACTAIVEAWHAKGYDQMLRLTPRGWQQIKQRREYTGLIVASTTRKPVGLSAHGALPPWLKRGGYGTVLLTVFDPSGATAITRRHAPRLESLANKNIALPTAWEALIAEADTALGPRK